MYPPLPLNLTAEAKGTDRIDLDWDTPSDDGGSPITGYRIEISENESGSWRVHISDTQNTTTSYIHRNLESAETLSYRVQAINKTGRGAWSNTAAGYDRRPDSLCASRTYSSRLRGLGNSLVAPTAR